MKHSEGFSLIEVMIGILVFTIGILGVVSMQTTSIAANAKAQNTSGGSALASSILAQLRPVDYDSLLLIPDPIEMPENAPDFYKVRLSATPLDDGPLDGEVALVSARVAWDDYGKSHETTFYYFRQDELR